MYTHMAVVNKTLTKTYYINYEPPGTFPPIHDIDIFLDFVNKLSRAALQNILLVLNVL